MFETLRQAFNARLEFLKKGQYSVDGETGDVVIDWTNFAPYIAGQDVQPAGEVLEDDPLGIR